MIYDGSYVTCRIFAPEQASVDVLYPSWYKEDEGGDNDVKELIAVATKMKAEIKVCKILW